MISQRPGVSTVILLGLLAILAMCAYAFLQVADRAGVPLFSYAFDDKPFQQSAWHAKPDQRGPMTDDLIKKRLRPGSLRADVRRLLGKPDTASTDASPEREDVYFLGSWSGFHGIDSDYLTIRYDSTDRVLDSYHWQG